MRLFPTLATAALATLLAAPAMAETLTVTGTGVVRAGPDMATINTGVTTQGETAREALDANSAAMADLIAALREAGLEDRDIQTSNFTVSPQYVYSDRRDADGYALPPQIQGYEVTNSVTIVVRDLDSLGSVLDQAVTVGANTVGGISFAVDDTTALEDEARRLAFAAAQAKARTYADAAGIRLGSIESITETDRAAPPQPLYRAEIASAAFDAAVPIQAGELTFTVTATVAWDIEDDRD